MKGSKLLPEGDALEYFLYFHKERNMTIREASTKVIEKICEFIKRARIPLAHKNKMIEKFEVLYQKYQLQNRGQRSALQVTKERAFKDDVKKISLMWPVQMS